MTEENQHLKQFDSIDKQILRILAQNPRIPYSKLAEHLENSGYEMSTEGIRYRVANIIETTTVFFLLDPQKLTWEMVRLAITTIDESEAKENTFQMVSDMPFWHVSRGIGTYDLFAVGTASSMNVVDTLITTVREYEFVEEIDYIVVTDRNRDMESYLSMDYIPTPEENEDSG